MADVSISIEPVTVAGPDRSRKRLLVRGRQRQIVKRLKSAIEAAIRADDREERRANNLGYGPTLVREVSGSGYARALSALLNRTNTMLAMRY